MNRKELYLSEYENRLLDTIESNLNYFNNGKSKGKLSAELFVSDGNKADLYKDGSKICFCITLDQLFWAVVGIVNYNRKEV